MSQFQHDARVAVRPIARQREGDSVTIGDLERQVFLTIPAEAMEILAALEAGKTVGESARLYEQAHGVTPDIDGLLDALADEGFVAPWGDAAGAAPPDIAPAPTLAWITPAIARRMFGRPLLGACAIAIAIAAALIASDPGLVPSPSVLVFHHDLALLGGAMFAITSLGIAVHELGHLLAARASGVPARIGFGNRLWILVAETDMTGMWLAPRRKRYLAFLAGPIIDVASAAALAGVLWGQRRGWIALSPTLEQLTGAVFFSYLVRLLWQCFVFIRTDFYYVLATALNCKSLLADTEDLLRNRWARLRGSVPAVDQSAIPAREMRAVRAYAWIWLGGRAVAFASLILITVPVLVGYASGLGGALTGRDSTYDTADLVVLAGVGLAVQGAGLVLWIRSLHRGRTQRRTNAMAAQ
ncbi:MAG: putative peptide zinc metalloprotease protein [Solirubrobacteraceae bacterium]|jgi:hypothetical protein|nr:putative peptide zinc metalloprotease protein [Solirubrobacteraceae bacterium]